MLWHVCVWERVCVCFVRKFSKMSGNSRHTHRGTKDTHTKDQKLLQPSLCARRCIFVSSCVCVPFEWLKGLKFSSDQASCAKPTATTISASRFKAWCALFELNTVCCCCRRRCSQIAVSPGYVHTSDWARHMMLVTLCPGGWCTCVFAICVWVFPTRWVSLCSCAAVSSVVPPFEITEIGLRYNKPYS